MLKPSTLTIPRTENLQDIDRLPQINKAYPCVDRLLITYRVLMPVD